VRTDKDPNQTRALLIRFDVRPIARTSATCWPVWAKMGKAMAEKDGLTGAKAADHS